MTYNLHFYSGNGGSGSSRWPLYEQLVHDTVYSPLVTYDFGSSVCANERTCCMYVRTHTWTYVCMQACKIGGSSSSLDHMNVRVYEGNVRAQILPKKWNKLSCLFLVQIREGAESDGMAGTHHRPFKKEICVLKVS